MAEKSPYKNGQIVWQDLTVKNAEQVKDFYSQVIGWKTDPHNMGEYNDYNVNLTESDETIAGICNARGTNANVPSQWLLYVWVEDFQASVTKCIELDGKILDGPRKMGGNNFCVIQDPAGACIALIGNK
jgi:uncharacterized protein